MFEKGVAMDRNEYCNRCVDGAWSLAGWPVSWCGGGGLVQYLLSGVLGSFVGSFVLNKADINIGINNEIGRDIATATIGAVIVMIIANILTEEREYGPNHATRCRRHWRYNLIGILQVGWLKR